MKIQFYAGLSILVMLFPLKAYAYLDPGTGSMIIQSLIAAVAGILYAVKLYWYKLKKMFSFKKQAESPSSEIYDDESATNQKSDNNQH